jgi:hypothetical protein
MSNEINDSRQTNIPAVGETDLDDKDAINEATSDNTESTIDSSATYQDDLDYKDSNVDPIINEETTSPAEELQIPETEFRDELNKYVDDDTGTGDDDMRETIEDRDEGDDNAASATQ